MRSIFPFQLALALVVTGCSTMKVQSEFDDGYSFTEFTHYAWVDPGDLEMDEPRISPRAKNRIVTAVEKELEAKGYRQASDRPPDFLIGIYAVSRYNVQVTDIYEYWQYGGGYDVSQDTRQLREGVLMLGVIDPERKEVVWRGWARDVINDPEPAKIDAKIDEAVKKILAGFPPQT